MKVQLLFFPGCPNVDATRACLARCLEALDLDVPIEEVDVTAEGVVESLRAFGSPTILIDGIAVGGPGDGDALSCRVYGGAGAPSEAEVSALLSRRRS